ncbi:response regulator transcription factor [Paenibacillus thiaminolyticus]|uniref:Response regulator transcription factor n=1 Tax=Paenibacillus thiaminolyticus TaxID=49283 RepID=A0AAJ1G757_PANTH|nr:response regulator transcription factor [Paenibacillus thiaminolyticus]MCY9535775.1 response regulator transcription factor [Paenibacillus thiaminolyticus]MCY9601033.1 response regulator transcription factor [Paenibacillus thiaminolyticus]MCY9609478.1 response regulator transcription factor [Paenibacillus thiaminolyticus]MCY9613248.1 response regulator transcription factor [Paenibacillus thiaminolyticus]MCY9617663.1 response regulator transcription factor [Paenibacillus thiaminolyticus]
MSMAGQPVFRVLIADDHAHAREGMRDILAIDSSFVIVGEAVNGEEAIAMTETVMPDMILMDISMPVMDGLEATKHIKERFPYVKIVMVTVSDDITHLFEALKKGAQGYLLKNLQPSAWHEYLRAIAIDEAPMSKELAFRILQEFSTKNSKAPAHSPLTMREREILERVARGESNKEIAAQFSLSEHTVKNHLKNILQKLHLENRVQLTRYALENGLVDS